METPHGRGHRGLRGVPTSGSNLRTEHRHGLRARSIAVNEDGTRAFVTLQEANAIAVLDLTTNAFTN